MTAIQVAEVLPPHLMVGYWGQGQQSEIEDLLARLVNQAATAHPNSNLLRQVGSYHLPESSDRIWGIAYSGPAVAADTDVRNAPEVSVFLSAAGLGCAQVDRDRSADAWVKLQRDRLILGRESFGRMPLYWTQQGQVVWFASRFNLLLPILAAPQLNLAAIYGYSCFSYVPTPLTPITEISALPAGVEQQWVNSTGRLTTGTGTRSLAWEESPEQIRDEATAIVQLQTLLQQAIAQQIADLADRPVGVFLSGGLDSSVVAALLVQAGVKVRAYTLDFGTAGTPEYPHAEQVAQFLSIPLTRVEASPRCIRQALLPTAQALDLPFGDGVTVPLFLLSQAASQEVRVIFNGEGGDQLFAGWTNKPLISAEVYQGHAAEETFAQQYLRTFHRLWGYEAQLFQPPVRTQIQQMHPQIWLQDALAPRFSTSLLHRLRRANLMLKGAQNIHPRATALGGGHGLKVRSPFCDLALAQWAFQIAPELHLQGSCEKYILKRAVESWLPPEIVWRPKRGMGVPLTAWCFQELWRDLGTWLHPAQLRQEGIWEPYLAIRIAAGEFGTLQGRRIGESLWLLLMWQVWRQTTFGQTYASPTFDHPFWLPAWLGQRYLQVRRRSKEW